jgi:hypothetical protein
MEELRILMLRGPYIKEAAKILNIPECFFYGLFHLEFLTDTRLRRFLAANDLGRLLDNGKTGTPFEVVAIRYGYSTRYVRSFSGKYRHHYDGEYNTTLSEQAIIKEASIHLGCDFDTLHKCVKYRLIDVDPLIRVVASKDYELLIRTKAPASSAVKFLAEKYKYSERYIRELSNKPMYKKSYDFNC